MLYEYDRVWPRTPHFDLQRTGTLTSSRRTVFFVFWRGQPTSSGPTDVYDTLWYYLGLVSLPNRQVWLLVVNYFHPSWPCVSSMFQICCSWFFGHVINPWFRQALLVQDRRQSEAAKHFPSEVWRGKKGAEQADLYKIWIQVFNLLFWQFDALDDHKTSLFGWFIWPRGLWLKADLFCVLKFCDEPTILKTEEICHGTF